VATPEEQVTARSVAYWEHMVAGDYGSAYKMLSPGFRARVSEFAYGLRFAARTKWNKVDLQQVDCEDGLRCVVTLKGEFTFVGNEKFPAHTGGVDVVETWIREGENWWLVPKR
jgi:hypothetical protein